MVKLDPPSIAPQKNRNLHLLCALVAFRPYCNPLRVEDCKVKLVDLQAGEDAMGRVARNVLRSVSAAALLAALSAPALAAETTQYTYDALGRVISAIDASGKKVVYTYDSAGNRTRVSNGAEFQEIIPTAFSASSNAGTTGLTELTG